MVISMKVTSKLAKDMGMAKESIWMGPSTQASTMKISRTEEVVNSRKVISCKGLYIWKDGERYEGEWADGKFHGKGIKTLPDGTIFDGDWEEGRPVG
jgi:hypothetical protein